MGMAGFNDACVIEGTSPCMGPPCWLRYLPKPGGLLREPAVVNRCLKCFCLALSYLINGPILFPCAAHWGSKGNTRTYQKIPARPEGVAWKL